MGLAIAGAYPTHLDMAKRIFRQRRQRRAVTGRGETYDEAVVATEGAIRAGWWQTDDPLFTPPDGHGWICPECIEIMVNNAVADYKGGV